MSRHPENHVIEDGLVIHEIELAAPPDEVFAMFLEPQRLVRWIGIDAQLDPRPGGLFRFEVQPGQFCEGQYVVIEPPSRIAFTWGWTDPEFGLPPGTSRVEVELTQLASGTRLRLMHHELPVPLRLIHDEGWAVFLSRLTSLALGGEAGPYPVGDPARRIQQLGDEAGS